MKSSFSFKIEANPGKAKKLDLLLDNWLILVNEKISELWESSTSSERYPPRQSQIGSGLILQAARKAWSLCKTARKLGSAKPEYKGKTLDLTVNQSYVNMTPSFSSFDAWASICTTEKRKRVLVPFNFHSHFNKNKTGSLRNCVRITRRKSGWFLTLVFDVEDAKESSKKRIGIDVGYTVSAATSDGQIYGTEVSGLLRNSKWRKYDKKEDMPYRQAANRIAKQIIADHPKADFAMEQLNFKGKRNRSKQFRTRLSRFAYMHLAHRLERLGKSEGFRVFLVNPAYTSQKCPQCGCVDKRNRNGEKFHCVSCAHSAHADTNGAVNINGGKAVVNYGKSATPDLFAYLPQEYPGTMGALRKKPKGIRLLVTDDGIKL